jgi:hypothetical protein
LLSLLTLGLGASAVQAQESSSLEKSDPFNKGAAQTESKTPNDQGAEMLDAQARILFARGETEKAIALQKQAAEKANNTADKFAETLSKYYGYPANGEVLRKLERIIIPDVGFEEISLEDAVNFLRARSQELDLTETDPTKKGVNSVIRHSLMRHPDAVKGQQVTADASPAPSIKELQIKNVSFATALKKICGAVNYKFSVDDGVITLEPNY